MVGGAGDPNAWGRLLVFSLQRSPFFEIFRPPLLGGFYSHNWLFVQKQASFFSWSGEAGLSRAGETCLSPNNLLRIFSVADFHTWKYSWEMRETPFGETNFVAVGP